MSQQLELRFDIPRDATPEEQNGWINGELKYWSDIQGKLIIGMLIIATIIKVETKIILRFKNI